MPIGRQEPDYEAWQSLVTDNVGEEYLAPPRYAGPLMKTNKEVVMEGGPDRALHRQVVK